MAHDDAIPGDTFIDRARLQRRHDAMATIGAAGRGGVNRQALSPSDAAARARLMSWAAARGFAAGIDAIGNLFIRRGGTAREAAPVVTGSHLDSQPTGGNYDGVYGVLAGFEAMESLEDRGIATKRPIELVVWTNEEGSRFAPTTMGSAVFAGTLPLAAALAAADRDGVTVRDALAETLAALPATASRPLGTPAFAYVEAHIEQGPVLEAEGAAIGVVTGIQGLRQIAVTVTGAEGHAGTTPPGRRRDALAAACRIIDALGPALAAEDERTRFTVGRLDIRPGSPNTIPGEAVFTIDLRHPDGATLERLAERIAAACHDLAPPCSVALRQLLHSAPVTFDPGIAAAVRGAAMRLGHRQRDIVSGATHDAGHVAALCPSGMIFVPCRDGLSHNEAESADPDQLAAGADVLAAVLLELAQA